MFLLNLVPLWWRWAAIGLLILAVWGHGYVKGGEAAEEKLEATKASIQAERDREALRSAQKVIQQKEITQDVTIEYEDTIRAIRAHYDQRLRNAKASPGVPALSHATAQLDAGAADCRSSAEYIELEGRAAETTGQLMDLQGWIARQAK